VISAFSKGTDGGLTAKTSAGGIPARRQGPVHGADGLAPRRSHPTSSPPTASTARRSSPST
jgi:hypothetical protein